MAARGNRLVGVGRLGVACFATAAVALASALPAFADEAAPPPPPAETTAATTTAAPDPPTSAAGRPTAAQAAPAEPAPDPRSEVGARRDARAPPPAGTGAGDSTPGTTEATPDSAPAGGAPAESAPADHGAGISRSGAVTLAPQAPSAPPAAPPPAAPPQPAAQSAQPAPSAPTPSSVVTLDVTEAEPAAEPASSRPLPRMPRRRRPQRRRWPSPSACGRRRPPRRSRCCRRTTWPMRASTRSEWPRRSASALVHARLRTTDRARSSFAGLQAGSSDRRPARHTQGFAQPAGAGGNRPGSCPRFGRERRSTPAAGVEGRQETPGGGGTTDHPLRTFRPGDRQRRLQGRDGIDVVLTPVRSCSSPVEGAAAVPVRPLAPAQHASAWRDRRSSNRSTRIAPPRFRNAPAGKIRGRL